MIVFLIKIYNSIIKFLGNFIFDKVARKLFKAKYSIYKSGCTSSAYMKNKVYGKIYYPKYAKSDRLRDNAPEMYSKEGRKLIPLFLRNDVSVNDSVVIDGKYIYSDKYNFSLNNHLYLDTAMLEVIGNPEKRYGMLTEPETIYPEAYEMLRQNKGMKDDFDIILTHSQKVLDSFENARPYCFFSNVLYRLQDENGNLPENWYELKDKDISIVSSTRTMCDLHKLRLELARKCKREKLADTYGTFDGGQYVQPSAALDNYRYSIAIENDIDSYWFTEKILNCFATMTIPVYIGASKISEFFNEDGIIRISQKDYDSIDRILKQCTKEEYDARIDIMKENYEKSKKFDNNWDFLYEQYLKEDLEK